MGMPVSIDVRDAGIRPGDLDGAFAWLHEVDQRFSTYRADSEISRLNRGELAADAAHPDVAAVLARCTELHDLTQGWFDAWATAGPRLLEAGAATGTRAPGLAGRDPSVALAGAIDPSGYVKGWAVEGAARLLEAAGARNFSVNAGGDVRVRGGALPAPGWRVGIQHPQRRDALAAVVAAAGSLAVATSGAYVRGDHVLDPRTGHAPQGVLSVTVTGHDLGTADAYATAAFAMGAGCPAWLANLHGYEALVILDDLRLLSTADFPYADD